MATGQGYRFTLYFGDDAVTFTDASVDFDGGELDTSASVYLDENGDPFINGEDGPAFTDCVGDLRTMTGDVTATIRDANVTALMTSFKAGDPYDAQEWSVYYAGVKKADGVGLFFRRFTLNTTTPGAAKLHMSFRSTRFGYTTY